MAQLDPIQKGLHQSPKSGRNQNISTIEQLLRSKDDSPTGRRLNNSPSSSNSNSPNKLFNSFPSPAKIQQDPEECSTPKKSVLTKVKDKAKKWKHSLSFKKKNDNGGDSTPPWDIKMEEGDHDHVHDHHDEEEKEGKMEVKEEEEKEKKVKDEDEDDDYYEEDPEYLGAPMYESEMAPENYKEKARQCPRPNPVIPEEHAAPSCEKHNAAAAAAANKTITEAMSERLAPAYAAFSVATTTIATKVASFTTGKKIDSSLSNEESEAQDSAVSDFDNSEPESEQKEGTTTTTTTTTTTSPQKSDKGISVKEYFMNKLEPGEDEKALSQVISEAITPRKSADEDKSVASKMRAAVTSLLQTEQPSESSSSSAAAANKTKNTLPNISPLSTPKLLRQKSVHCPPGTAFSPRYPMTNRVVTSSPPIPISTNAEEVDDDDNNGRILQPN